MDIAKLPALIYQNEKMFLFTSAIDNFGSFYVNLRF